MDEIDLNPNQYAQNFATNGGFGPFEVGPHNDQSLVYSIETTNGCTCAQIVAELEKGDGHLRKGCSPSVMEEFTGLSAQPDRDAGIGLKNGGPTGAVIAFHESGSPISPMGLAGFLAVVAIIVVAAYESR